MVMEGKYIFESFNSDMNSFDQEFTDYLNNKRSEHWKVKNCSFCHDTEDGKMWASCLFKRKG